MGGDPCAHHPTSADRVGMLGGFGCSRRIGTCCHDLVLRCSPSPPSSRGCRCRWPASASSCWSPSAAAPTGEPASWRRRTSWRLRHSGRRRAGSPTVWARPRSSGSPARHTRSAWRSRWSRSTTSGRLPCHTCVLRLPGWPRPRPGAWRAPGGPMPSPTAASSTPRSRSRRSSTRSCSWSDPCSSRS